MFVRIAKLVALISACSSLGELSFGGEPPKAALCEVKIVDVRVSLEAPRKDDHQVFRLEAQRKEDKKFVRRLWEAYGPVFGFEDWNSFGPDSSYRQILLAWDGRRMVLKSWHPVFERDSKLVVTSYGVTSLDGRRRADVLKSDDAGYVRKREAFDAIVSECLSRNAHRRPLDRPTAGRR